MGKPVNMQPVLTASPDLSSPKRCRRFISSPFPVSPRSGLTSPFLYFRDNQQLRWLEGLDRFSLARRPRLRKADFVAAKFHLAAFNEVFILEDMHRRDRTKLARYGWN